LSLSKLIILYRAYNKGIILVSFLIKVWMSLSV
jgi:hypothetical protein